MKIGITGTKNGGTLDQLFRVKFLLEELDAEEFHHGDCVGVDEQAHEIARHLFIPIVIHPPKDPKHRAFCEGKRVTLLEERLYLTRNRDIVDAVDHLIVVPQDGRERGRGSGTWATYRYAKRIGRPFTVLLP